MNRPSEDPQHSRVVYGKDEHFDIEVGMAVVGLNGQSIGSVTEIAGFGSTQVPEPAPGGAAVAVTQAQSGTGYIKVDRRDVAGKRDAPPLCVPFHGIERVTAERTVVLNGTAISELRAQADRTSSVPVLGQPTQRGRWQRWIPGRRP